MKDTAYFCTQCGSPSVERSPLAGGNAKCTTCGWTGKNEDLHAVDFEHDFSSPEQIMQVFVTEFSGVIAKHLAAPLGATLLKWGFIDQQGLGRELGVYMKNIATAAAKAVFETRKGLAEGTIVPPARKGVH